MLDKIKKIRKITGRAKKIAKWIFLGKCALCGEDKEEFTFGPVCANRECRNCGINKGS